MSSNKRPWYQWWPKDFVADEKVQCLSANAELVYRRTLDLMWQANDCRLLNNCLKLANGLSKGLSQEQFEIAWAEIQTEGFELLKTSSCGKWVYAQRLSTQMELVVKTSKKRIAAGKKGGQAIATFLLKPPVYVFVSVFVSFLTISNVYISILYVIGKI